MNDVIHHARPTQSQMAAGNHQSRFRANIEARAEAIKLMPVIIKSAEPEITLVPVKARRSFDDLVFGPVVLPGAVDMILPTCAEVVKATAKHFGIPKVEMLSSRRQAEMALARQVAMYLCSSLTLRSLPFIGRTMGDRDHTTVLHGIRKIQGQVLAGNTVVIEAIDALTIQLGGH